MERLGKLGDRQAVRWLSRQIAERETDGRKTGRQNRQTGKAAGWEMGQRTSRTNRLEGEQTGSIRVQ